MIHMGGDGEMWDEEDGFFYDVLRLPTAGPAAQGALDGGPAAALRGDGHQRGRDRQAPRARASGPLVRQRRAPSSCGNIHDPRQLGVAGPPAAVAPQREQAAAGAGAHARRERVPEPVRHPLAVALPPRSPLRLRRRRPGVPGRLSARRVGHADVRRQLELARPDLDAGQRPHHPGALQLLLLLRRRLHGRMSDRLGSTDEPLRGRRGDRRRLRGIFLRDKEGGGPSTAPPRKFQDDPHWRDYLLFYEYFHGDNGAGIGASHQTGWTGLVATFMHYFATISATEALELWSMPSKLKPQPTTDVPALQR